MQEYCYSNYEKIWFSYSIKMLVYYAPNKIQFADHPTDEFGTMLYDQYGLYGHIIYFS